MKTYITIMLLFLMTPVLGCSESGGESGGSTARDRIEFLKMRVEDDPYAYAYYNMLGQAYIEKARETGETSYYLKAGEALRESLRINPKNYIGTVYMASVSASKHNFVEALEYAKRAVDIKPHESYSYAVLGDAYLELGELEKAEESYSKMHAFKPGLDSYSRISNLKRIKGDTLGAIDAMKKAYEAGLGDPRTPKENLAWTQFMTGSLYQGAGNHEEAELHYKRSVEILPGYYLAREHLAELQNSIHGEH